MQVHICHYSIPIILNLVSKAKIKFHECAMNKFEPRATAVAQDGILIQEHSIQTVDLEELESLEEEEEDEEEDKAKDFRQADDVIDDFEEFLNLMEFF